MPRAPLHHLFGSTLLNMREVRKLQHLVELVRFQPRQTIFTEGNVADDVYSLAEGVVRVYKTLPDGRRHVLRFALPGEFLELPIAESQSLSADATGAVAANRFARGELSALIRSSRNMSRLMLDFAARELEHSRTAMLFIGRGTPEERTVAFQKSWRKRLRLGKSKHVPLPMTRRDLAAHLGMAHETLTVRDKGASLSKAKCVRVSL
jgi:CRP/FNR family transcriptional regulator